MKDYLAIGWFGAVPQSCRGIDIFVPTRENLGRIHPSLAGILLTEVLWGWPEIFITRMNEHGSKVYASQIDSLSELEGYLEVGLSGIMTNRIELIGPAIK